MECDCGRVEELEELVTYKYKYKYKFKYKYKYNVIVEGWRSCKSLLEPELPQE